MSLDQSIDILNDMIREGIIRRYAIAGAVAAIYYVEVTSTDDLDVLVSFDPDAARAPSGLVMLTPILRYLAGRGYDQFRHEGVLVEGWPIQFLPVAGALDAEALAHAAEVELKMPSSEVTIKTYVLRPEHLVAKAIELQRPTDMMRISQFLEHRKVEFPVLAEVLRTHHLEERWKRYCRMTGRLDLLRI